MPRVPSKALRVSVVRLPHGAGLPLPAYQSDAAAGMDLVAAVDEQSPVILPPGGRALIPTGLILELPAGAEGQVRPRSGLALRHGITVLNSPGTIDSDYRGEVKVLLINLGNEAREIQRGERIAQLVIQRVEHATLAEVAAVNRTRRGDGGFGSTGTKTKTAPRPRSKARAQAAASPKTSKDGRSSKLRPRSK